MAPKLQAYEDVEFSWPRLDLSTLRRNWRKWQFRAYVREPMRDHPLALVKRPNGEYWEMILYRSPDGDSDYWVAKEWRSNGDPEEIRTDQIAEITSARAAAGYS